MTSPEKVIKYLKKEKFVYNSLRFNRVHLKLTGESKMEIFI